MADSFYPSQEAPEAQQAPRQPRRTYYVSTGDKLHEFTDQDILGFLQSDKWPEFDAPARINIVDPDTEARQSIAFTPQQLKLAFKQGWSLEPKEITYDHWIKKEYDSPVAAGLLGVARGATFGISDMLLDNIGANKHVLEAYERANPASSLVGEFTGALAPIIVGGPVGAAGRIARGERATTAGIRGLTKEPQLAKALAAGAAGGKFAQVLGATEKMGALSKAIAGKGLTYRPTQSGLRRLIGGLPTAKLARATQDIETALLKRWSAGATTASAPIRALTKTGARAIPWGMEGAAYGVGHEVSRSVLDNKPLTGEEILSGAGMGGLWGAAFGVGTKGLGFLWKGEAPTVPGTGDMAVPFTWKDVRKSSIWRLLKARGHDEAQIKKWFKATGEEGKQAFREMHDEITSFYDDMVKDPNRPGVIGVSDETGAATLGDTALDIKYQNKHISVVVQRIEREDYGHITFTKPKVRLRLVEHPEVFVTDMPNSLKGELAHIPQELEKKMLQFEGNIGDWRRLMRMHEFAEIDRRLFYAAGQNEKNLLNFYKTGDIKHLPKYKEQLPLPTPAIDDDLTRAIESGSPPSKEASRDALRYYLQKLDDVRLFAEEGTEKLRTIRQLENRIDEIKQYLKLPAGKNHIEPVSKPVSKPARPTGKDMISPKRKKFPKVDKGRLGRKKITDWHEWENDEFIGLENADRELVAVFGKKDGKFIQLRDVMEDQFFKDWKKTKKPEMFRYIKAAPRYQGKIAKFNPALADKTQMQKLHANIKERIAYRLRTMADPSTAGIRPKSAQSILNEGPGWQLWGSHVDQEILWNEFFLGEKAGMSQLVREFRIKDLSRQALKNQWHYPDYATELADLIQKQFGGGELKVLDPVWGGKGLRDLSPLSRVTSLASGKDYDIIKRFVKNPQERNAALNWARKDSKEIANYLHDNAKKELEAIEQWLGKDAVVQMLNKHLKNPLAEHVQVLNEFLDKDPLVWANQWKWNPQEAIDILDAGLKRRDLLMTYLGEKTKGVLHSPQGWQRYSEIMRNAREETFAFSQKALNVSKILQPLEMLKMLDTSPISMLGHVLGKAGRSAIGGAGVGIGVGALGAPWWVAAGIGTALASPLTILKGLDMGHRMLHNKLFSAVKAFTTPKLAGTPKLSKTTVAAIDLFQDESKSEKQIEKLYRELNSPDAQERFEKTLDEHFQGLQESYQELALAAKDEAARRTLLVAQELAKAAPVGTTIIPQEDTSIPKKIMRRVHKLMQFFKVPELILWLHISNKDTPEDRELARAVNPNLYAQMQMMVLEQLANSKEELPRQRLLSLERFLEMPLVKKDLSIAQAATQAMNSEAGLQAGPAPGRGDRPAPVSASKIIGRNAETEMDSIARRAASYS